ncbi:Crp/Fnr family transcriptional regulator [Streptomyces alkaliphilus]|uniref:Cyclic nucleotide-binding domain-containing protein n=1 Tax=Streptomyces alkaliphilus TaxID=1472722 RepID=A0A7W3Y3X3_9ACTN|nr:cyclic nucleotide-binding domain-containing protein [Streptomyces alkaliphilus]MBB0246941.1 cyclic nucleotide-binding domain-containing protein [Streptomyces alkaliphilus]MQS09224.1 cyclic nucleotide-binding domain-containing protein [Streptomyces alkaliphilus]
MPAPKQLLKSLSPEYRERLLRVSREVSFPQGHRIFEERGRADRFWVLRSGSVTLDLRLPGDRTGSVAILDPGDLLGWSWLFPPYEWDFGAEAVSPVRAHEFLGSEVRELCDRDPAFGYLLMRLFAEILANRLRLARSRALDLYAPRAAGW